MEGGSEVVDRSDESFECIFTRDVARAGRGHGGAAVIRSADVANGCRSSPRGQDKLLAGVASKLYARYVHEEPEQLVQGDE